MDIELALEIADEAQAGGYDSQTHQALYFLAAKYRDADSQSATRHLNALVSALNNTYWSSWQSTATFWPALETANKFLSLKGTTSCET